MPFQIKFCVLELIRNVERFLLLAITSPTPTLLLLQLGLAIAEFAYMTKYCFGHHKPVQQNIGCI